MSIHDKCWQAFFVQYGGPQAALKKLRINGKLELDGSVLAKCGSKKSYSGSGKFSKEGPIHGAAMKANVLALKHFIPEHLKPNEVIQVFIDDERKAGNGISVVLILL